MVTRLTHSASDNSDYFREAAAMPWAMDEARGLAFEEIDW
jgi:hypothetical protein